MAAKKKQKILKFANYMRKKIVIMFLLIFLLLAALVARLMYIQKIDGERYEKIVLNQQGFDSQTIPFRRGDILDSKGTILATSKDVYNMILDCRLIHEDERYLEPTINAILTCFNDVTEEELRTLLREREDSQYCVLRKYLPYEEILDFIQLENEVYTEGEKKGNKVNPYVKGVWFEKEYIRNYPYDTLACKVLGFTTSGNVGIGGLEDYYNDILNGVNGREYGYLNADNNFEKTIVEATNGCNLVTTLDLNVQSIVERKIVEFNEEHRNGFVEGPGSKNTAVLVMNPQKGEIIAMADSTGYSLNNPWDEDILTQYCMEYKAYTAEDVQMLDEDAKIDMLNALWQNFCITYTYEPGSTVKPLTVATGLDAGKILGNETYYCDGGQHIGGYDIACVNNEGHGIQTIEEAIMHSCNDALMQMGSQIGVDIFTKYQNIFNIGLRTGIDLPGEARTDTLIYTAENMGETSLATNSFGQNFNVTMVQVASAFASIINGGYYYQPHLVKQIVDENGGIVQNIEPTLMKQTISEATRDLVRGYLVSTIVSGSGRGAKVSGYSMGGKTGTAEKHPRDKEKYLVSFIGFAPAENPQVLIYVVINEPNVENQAQSGLATKLAKEIMAEIFPYLNIFPDEPVEETGTQQPADVQEPTDAQQPEDVQGPTEPQEPTEDTPMDTQEPAEDAPENAPEAVPDLPPEGTSPQESEDVP